MSNVLLGFFLAVHGLIHLGYVTPAPADPKYPFRLNQSWLIASLHLPEQTVRLLGMTLSIITVLGFALAGLAALGIIVPQAWWQPLTILSAAASLLLLVFFWHTWLVLGVIIDVALLVALLWLNWQPFAAS
ncbi:MAG: hypothetical protein K8I30_09975 [Anaerolineae bacterium]|nr:hypothetical protein [Anaerolineae bacterium]